MRRVQQRSGGRANAKQQISREYLAGLKDYWAGRPRTAIEHVSKVLADNPEDTSKFSLYRLWIEVLAGDADRRALRSLAQHLYLRSQEDESTYDTYMALRGLIHLELDEIEAVQLMRKALNGSESKNAYILELHQRTEERFAENVEDVPNLLAELPARYMHDYFHWEVIARNFLVSGRQKELDHVLHKIQQLYPESTLSRVYRMHQAFAGNKYEIALQIAQSLNAEYPGVADFEVFQAFAMMKLGRAQDAHQILARHVSIFGAHDVDVMSLLSESMHRLLKSDSELVNKEQVVETFKSTLKTLQDNGAPGRYVQQALYEMTAADAVVDGEGQVGHNRIWLVKLTPAQYHELQTSSEESLQTISRPLGTEPQPGDLCFLATESYEGTKRAKSESWRIAGIYTVVSSPEIDAMHGFVSMLRLIQRPGISIPVDIQPLDRPAIKSRPGHRGVSNANVFELDQAALSIIAEAANQRLNRGRENRELFDELARVRQIS